MCEEYLSSKEIVQKIADLKIRLALQQEFEQEVDELVAEVDPTGAGQSRNQSGKWKKRYSGTLLLHTSRRRPQHRTETAISSMCACC